MTGSKSAPRVAVLATEYKFNRVGGLGAHIRGLVPALSNLMPVDLVLPAFDASWPRSERLGRYGYVHRVDAERPQAGPDYDHQVWVMNDRLSDYVIGRMAAGAHFRLVHAHDWLVGYSANLLHNQHDLPLVVTIHATESGRVRDAVNTVDLSRRIHLAEVHLARNADLVITTSEFMRAEILQNLGANADRVEVIPNGIDSSGFHGLRRRRRKLQDFRQRYAAPDEPLLFYVGRLVWEKGPDVLVDAVHMLRDHVPGVRAVIAGTGSMRQDLVYKIAALSLQDRVELVGYIDDETRDRFYAVADAAVFPSRYEPFGIVALEAMAAGVPVVVGGGGLAEVVTAGVTGLVAEPGSAASLMECLLSVLKQPEAAAERVRRAQLVVEEQYTWKRVAAQTMQAYQRVLAQKQAAAS